jgi:hypothetical protein
MMINGAVCWQQGPRPEAFCEAILMGKKVSQWEEMGVTSSFRQGLESIPS